MIFIFLARFAFNEGIESFVSNLLFDRAYLLHGIVDFVTRPPASSESCATPNA